MVLYHDPLLLSILEKVLFHDFAFLVDIIMNILDVFRMFRYQFSSAYGEGRKVNTFHFIVEPDSDKRAHSRSV